MRVRSVVLACLLCLAAPAALAQDRYDVEIIVFEHTGERAVAEERWRAAIVAPDFERAGLLENAGAGDGTLPEGFEALPPREGRLIDSVAKLEERDAYRVLRHLRWRQPALEPGESVPVRVRAGEAVPITTPVSMLRQPVPSRGNRLAQAEQADDDDTGAAGESDGAGQPQEAEPGAGAATGRGSPDDDPAETTGYAYIGPYGPRERTVAVHPLDGTIELVVSRYLHLHVDLYRTTAVDWDRLRGREEDEGDAAGEPGNGAEDPARDEDAVRDAPASDPLLQRRARGPDGEAMLSFPFRQSRRMRSGNLHYIDHPRLGVLVLVTPHEEDDDGADAEAGE